MELLVRVRTGDLVAADALLERCLPPLKRWAHGKLPRYARGALDTDDIVQAAVLQLLRRLDRFEPQHVGAMQGYLRQSVVNRIRDEIRRVGRRPPADEPLDEMREGGASPLERAIQNQAYERYRSALGRLRLRDRELIVARIELQWPMDEITARFGYPTSSAARMAVTRAAKRLTTLFAAAS